MPLPFRDAYKVSKEVLFPPPEIFWYACDIPGVDTQIARKCMLHLKNLAPLHTEKNPEYVPEFTTDCKVYSLIS